MQAEMLSSILHVRAGLKRNKSCCHDYEILPAMVADVGSVKIYDKKILDVDESTNQIEDEDLDIVFDILSE